MLFYFAVSFHYGWVCQFRSILYAHHTFFLSDLTGQGEYHRKQRPVKLCSNLPQQQVAVFNEKSM